MADTASKTPESPPETAGSSVVARFVGDGSIYVNGVPNRDLTSDDLAESPGGFLTAAQVKAAIKAGTHAKGSD